MHLIGGGHADVEHAVVQLVDATAVGGWALAAEPAAAAARVVVPGTVDDHGDPMTAAAVDLLAAAVAAAVATTAEPPAQVHHAQGQVGVDRAQVLADAAEMLGALSD